jgi:hypothetical protein
VFQVYSGPLAIQDEIRPSPKARRGREGTLHVFAVQASGSNYTVYTSISRIPHLPSPGRRQMFAPSNLSTVQYPVHTVDALPVMDWPADARPSSHLTKKG